MFRETAGRLLIIGAGTGCLVLLIFVVVPMMNQPAPRMSQDEIVAEVLGSDKQDDEGGDQDVPGTEAVMERPSPLVGVWNDGREGAVVFTVPESPAGEAEVLPEEVVAEEVPAQEIVAVEKGLPEILSEQDVAEARAALDGEGSGPEGAVEPDSTEESENDVAAIVEPPEAVALASGEENMASLVAAAAGEAADQEGAGEADIDDGRDSEEPATVVPEPVVEVAVEELEGLVRAVVREMDLAREGAGVDDRPRSVERQAVRRGEFEMPVSLNSRSRREVSHPSGEIMESEASEAAQAGNQPLGLPPRTGAIVPGTLRGVMGYRLPLVSRQEVPDQIVSGVLIPAHTTFVILKEGAWELVDVTPEELQRLKDAEARREAAAVETEPVRKGWNPLRIFRKRETVVED